MCIDRIMNSKTLFDLLDAVNQFCVESALRDDDSECMKLKENVEKSDNEYLILLSSYLCACEDGEEIIDSLYEFNSNCSGFAEANEDTTQQVTKEEFETVLSECEEKCGAESCIKADHKLNLIEVNAVSNYDIYNVCVRNNISTLFLPRIDKNTDKRKFIAEQLGSALYDVIKTKIPQEEIKQEISRYIPETISAEKSTKQLFKEYFYNVVLYKERKPGIYTELDEQMKQTIVLEFYKKIIIRYMRMKN